MGDQGRRREIAGVADRALVIPLPALFPDRHAHAYLALEAAVIGAVLRLVVDRADMGNEAFEALRRAVEPVDEIAAIAAADGGEPILVDEWMEPDRLVDAGEDVE